MTSINVRLYTYRATKEGTYPLVFQIIHNREKRVIYSSYSIDKECFDTKQGLVINKKRKKHINADEINNSIQTTLQQLTKIIEMLKESKKNFSVAEIASLYKAHCNNSLVLIYLQKLIDQYKEDNKLSTADSYISLYHKLTHFLGGIDNFHFSDITSEWLAHFVKSLEKTGLKESTVRFYCCILRALYNKAYREKISGTDSNSPFCYLTFGSISTEKRAANSVLINTLANADIKFSPTLDFARDLFMFSFYSRGMPFVDMAYLKRENIVNGTIYYNRHKTGKSLRVKIVPQMNKLIEKYLHDSEYVFPILQESNKSLYQQYRNELRKFNNRLKRLSHDLSLHFNITSYVARHTWATQARNAGASVSIISESLGHSSEKITYTYLAALDPVLIDSINDKISRLYI